MFDRKLLRYADGRLGEHTDLSNTAVGTIDDMIIDSSGRIYVGDLGIDLLNPNRKPDAAKGSGRVILVTPDGKARAVAEGLSFPNGIAISGDGKTMVVAESDGDCLARFDIRADGSLDFKQRFGNFGEPDGICMDRDDAVWVSLFKEDAFVRVDLAGNVLRRIPVPGRRAIACVLGGADRRTLFCITAETTHEDLFRGKSRAWLEAIEVANPGVGFP
jgi:sugar lactone lactonase YvrE